MKLTVVEQNELVNHPALSGSLDIEGVQAVENELSRMTSVLRVHTILDFSQVDYVASLGLGLLVTAARNLSMNGRKLVIVNAKSSVRDVIRTANLDRFLPVVDSAAGAYALFQPQQA